MGTQNHESKFEGTPEIESLNIADIDFLYSVLEEDAALYGGRGINFSPSISFTKSVPASVIEDLSKTITTDLSGLEGSLPQVSICDILFCLYNNDLCTGILLCGNDNYVDDGCSTNKTCPNVTAFLCFTNLRF